MNRLALALALAGALTVVGCGKREPTEAARTAKAQSGKDASMSPARIEAKSRVQSQPNSGEARFQLGKLLLGDGEAAPALVELQRALEFKYPEDQVLPLVAEAMVLSGQARKVIEAYADKTLNDAEAHARLQAAVAHALAATGEMDRAGTVVAAALTKAPKSAPALLIKARLQAAANDNSGGLATLDVLLAAHPSYHEAWALKGELLLRSPTGAKQAIEAFNKALEAKPDQVFSHSALVSLYLSQGDIDSARKAFAKLQKLAPKHPTTALFDAHLAYASGDHARARDIYLALLRALPENVNVLLSAGENELRLNAAQQAEAYFAKAVSLAPRNALARRLLAQAQIKLGQATKAQLTLAPLLDDPNASAEVLAIAAQARLMSGDAKAADALYTRLAQLKPVDPRLRTVVATANFGKASDDVVFSELGAIAAEDAGTTADMALISAHMRRQQPEPALQALANLERKRPGNAFVHQLRGQVLVMKGDKAGARKSFESALSVDANYFPAVAAMAALDVLEQKPDAARNRLADVVKKQPKNAQALLALAELAGQQGAPRAEVLKQLEAAAKAAPTDVDIRTALISNHFNANDFEAALVAAQAASTAIPESLELLELLARCQLRLQQASQALTTYGKIASLNPKSPRAFVGMADVHLAGNDLDAAQRNINKALELSPDLPESMGQAIMVALRKRQPATALEIARKVQTIRPTQAEGFLLEGQIEMERGNWDGAASALRKSLDKVASGPAAIKLHHVLLRANKAAEANNLTDNWLKAHPQDTQFRFYLGDLAQGKGDPATAERRYQEVLDIEPNHVLALNNLAMLLVQQKKPGATALAERALRSAPDQPSLLDTLAQALAADNKLPKAIEAQRRAVSLAPDEGVLRLGLAKLLIQSGDKAQAKGELDKLAAMGAKFSQQAEVKQLRDSLGAR